jgi:two-component system, NarL family, nitrate/nitrite response regulator NarL
MAHAAPHSQSNPASGGGPGVGAKRSSASGRGTRHVRVVMCDGHPLFLEAFVRSVREWPEFEVVDAVDDFASLMALDCRSADVLLIDPESLDIDAEDALAWAQDGPRVLCISMETPSERLYRALTLGVSGYIDKSCSKRELCDAIAATARGEARLGSNVQASLAKAIRIRHGGKPDLPATSPREREVLKLMARGLNAPEIAAALCLSTATVKTHQNHIYKKLEVHNAAAAVATAMRLGLIE